MRPEPIGSDPDHEADADDWFAAPHPDKPHEFRITCRLCGEPGVVNLTILAPGELITVNRDTMDQHVGQKGRRAK